MSDRLLEMSRCGSCHAAFQPRPGVCPRCGSSQVGTTAVAARGKVLAATELTAPARGWASPHRLALIEISEGIRLLAVVTGALPSVGDEVSVSFEAPVYRVG